MAYIKVNHTCLVSAAEKIDEYVKKLDNNMISIDTTMGLLGMFWNGKDYKQLKKEWLEIKAEDSTTGYMKKSLRNYAGTIREASKKYKKQQAKAIANAKYYCK